MASMNISVPDSMREWVQRRIESGDYASVSDYVRDLIRRDQNAQARQLSVDDIRRTIEEGRAAGGAFPAEEVFARHRRQTAAAGGLSGASEDASSLGSPRPTSQRLRSTSPRTVRRPRYASSTNCEQHCRQLTEHPARNPLREGTERACGSRCTAVT